MLFLDSVGMSVALQDLNDNNNLLKVACKLGIQKTTLRRLQNQTYMHPRK